MEEFLKNFQHKVKLWMTDAEMNQTELGEEAGVNQSRVSQILSPACKDVKLSTVIKICGVFKKKLIVVDE